MTLVVHPDPQEPAGGYAFFELPKRSLMGELAPVAIFDASGERWLGPAPEGAVPVEPGPWQGDRHSFGPYQVYRHEGADWVRVGPEIVNRLEEYQPLKITVGMEEYSVTWPDDVPPRAGAAALGGILIPMALDRMNIDPALASGPFVTTVTDVVGFFLFLGLAAQVLL